MTLAELDLALELAELELAEDPQNPQLIQKCEDFAIEVSIMRFG